MRTPSFEDVVQGVATRIGEKRNIPLITLNDVTTEVMSDYGVEYHIQGDFTVATMFTKSCRDEDRVTFVGVSKRNPTDRMNGLRGKALALSRAVRKTIEFELTRGDRQKAVAAAVATTTPTARNGALDPARLTDNKKNTENPEKEFFDNFKA